MSDDQLPGLLYHYTDLIGLTRIIQSRKLWATHIRCLNDESEFRYGRQLLGSNVESIRAEFQNTYAAKIVFDSAAALATAPSSLDIFVASLCEDGDNLGQWRGFGGFAIGFRRESLAAISEMQDYSLIRVIYDVDEQAAHVGNALKELVPIVKAWATDNSNAPPALEQLLLIGSGLTIVMLWIKNPFFRDEREWRLDRVNLSGPPIRERKRELKVL
jgi:hypothetical protein